MKERRKRDPYIDRRSAEDRRQLYDLNYFLSGGVERRNKKERRQQGERRSNFIKVSEWSSAYAGDTV
jgi:hypothetical protein